MNNGSTNSGDKNKYSCEYCGKDTHLSKHCFSIKCQVCGQSGRCWPNLCRASEQVKVNATANESDGYDEDFEVDEDSNAKLADTFKVKNPRPTSSGDSRKVKFTNGN